MSMAFSCSSKLLSEEIKSDEVGVNCPYSNHRIKIWLHSRLWKYNSRSL